jgi:GDP-D-glucose phosphorylase
MDWMQGEGHMIAVNVSPIDRGHVLLVPEPSSCLPQVMTQSSLQLCLELVSLSGHRCTRGSLSGSHLSIL